MHECVRECVCVCVCLCVQAGLKNVFLKRQTSEGNCENWKSVSQHLRVECFCLPTSWLRFALPQRIPERVFMVCLCTLMHISTNPQGWCHLMCFLCQSKTRDRHTVTHIWSEKQGRVRKHTLEYTVDSLPVALSSTHIY